MTAAVGTEVDRLIKRLMSGQAPRMAGQLIAFIYARCSSDPYGRGKSVERQVEDCWQDCLRNGWHVGAIFVDNDRSASTYANKVREEYGRMMAEMRRTEVNVLVCWEASRATRDVRTYLDLADLSRELEVKWCFNGSMYDLRDEDDEFRTMLETVLGHREVRKLAKRVKDGMAKAARDGRPHGRAPYGYYRTYDPRTREFLSQEIDDIPRETVDVDGNPVTYTPAGVVREIITRLAGADSVHHLIKDLDRRGIPSVKGRTWSSWAVRGIAMNPTYAGWRMYQGKPLRRGIWKPIVDDATLQAATLRLEDPQRKTARTNRAKHLLSCFTRCGECQDRLVAQMRKRTGRQLSYWQYRCATGCVAIKQEKLDAYVESVLIERLADPATLDWLVRPDDTDAQKAAEESASLRATIEKWKAKAKAGTIDPDEYDEIVSGLKARAAELDAQAAPAFVPVTLHGLIGDQAAEAWDRLGVHGKRDIIRSIMHIELWKAESGVRFDPSRIRIKWVLDGKLATAPRQLARAA